MVYKSYLLTAAMAIAAAPLTQAMGPVAFKDCAESDATGTIEHITVYPNPPEW